MRYWIRFQFTNILKNNKKNQKVVLIKLFCDSLFVVESNLFQKWKPKLKLDILVLIPQNELFR